MIRFLVPLFLIVAAIWLYKRLSAQAQRTMRQPVKKRPAPATQKMVQCDYCHVYLPQDQAVKRNNAWYCPEHTHHHHES